jgi:mersacidin/lichenicidin family type 2 lantibiotic
MSQQDIIRAWKDPEFRNSLSEAQRSQLPENPAGTVELTDLFIEAVIGGQFNLYIGGTVGRDCTYYPVCHQE